MLARLIVGLSGALRRLPGLHRHNGGMLALRYDRRGAFFAPDGELAVHNAGDADAVIPAHLADINRIPRKLADGTGRPRVALRRSAAHRVEPIGNARAAGVLLCVHLKDHAHERRGFRIRLQRPALAALDLDLAIAKRRRRLPQALRGGGDATALQALFDVLILTPGHHHIGGDDVLVPILRKIIGMLRRDDLRPRVLKRVDDEALIHQVAARKAGDLDVEHAVIHAGGHVAQQALHLRPVAELISGDQLAVFGHDLKAHTLREIEQALAMALQ